MPQNNTPERIVAEMVDDQILEMPDHSAIAEGVSQIFRRKKKGKPGQGFRCTSGPRKGRIVAKPSTCFQKTDPQRSAKIRKKRQQKARLAGVQIKKRGQKGKSLAPKMKSSKPVKSQTIKPRKR